MWLSSCTQRNESGARAHVPHSPPTVPMPPHPLLWGDEPSPALQPQPWHLEFLQLLIEVPEVLGKEFGADGLPVDSNPLTHLHQVGRAAERPGVIGTPPPEPRGLPYPPRTVSAPAPEAPWSPQESELLPRASRPHRGQAPPQHVKAPPVSSLTSGWCVHPIILLHPARMRNSANMCLYHPNAFQSQSNKSIGRNSHSHSPAPSTSADCPDGHVGQGQWLEVLLLTLCCQTC